jgi:MFS family permease
MLRFDNAQQKTSKTMRANKLLAPILNSMMLRNRTLFAVSLAVCTAYTGIGMVVPVRVLYAQEHGASLTIISAMASAYLVSNFLAQYPAGWLADRWGRKQLIVIGLLVQAALSAAYLLLTDPLAFVLIRFLEGIAGAAVLLPARALIADAVPLEKRGEAYGVYNSFFNAAFLLGPAIGGLLAASGYATVFIGAIIFRLVAVPVVVIMIQSTYQPGAVTREHAAAVPRRALFTLPLVGAYFLAFGDYLYLGFELALLPLWIHYHLGASVSVIGLIFAIAAIPIMLLSPISGRIADRSRRSMLILIFGLGMVPLYISYGLSNSILLVIGLYAVHGTIFAIVQPAVDAHVAASSPPDARGRVQGMYTTVGLASAFIGSIGLTFLYGLNFRLPLFTLAIVVCISVLVGGTMVRISEVRGLVSSAKKDG